MPKKENQNLDPNRSPEGFQPGGGPAVSPDEKSIKKNRSRGGLKQDIASSAARGGLEGGAEGAKDAVRGTAAKAVGEAAGDAVAAGLVSTGVGTVLAGVGRWVTKKATEAAAKWGLKDGNWLKIALVPIFSLILMFTVGAVAIAGIVKANRGAYGNEVPTPISMTNPEDRSDLTELMRLSGDYSKEDAEKILVLLDKIADRIALGKLTFVDQNKALEAMEKVRIHANLVVLGTTTRTTKEKLKVAIEEFVDLYAGDNPAPLQGDFFSPVGDQTIFGFNNSLHGRSSQRPEDTDGHDVFKGHDSPGVGDAVDIVIGRNKPVFAMFTGNISAKGSGSKQCAVLTDSGNQVELYYCHLGNIVTGTVSRGQQIGTTAYYKHVHFEAWVGGQSVHTTSADILSKKYSQKGRYLWDHMVFVFGLNQ